jgi:hypothetical protein
MAGKGDRVVAIGGGILFTQFALASHGPLWRRMTLSFLFTLAGLIVIQAARAVWRDRWFWRQTWREFTRARHH